jgi:hypothetical protein
MRRFGLFLVGGAALLMSVAWVDGQQAQKKGAGGFQFGGMVPGGGREDPVTLFHRKDVKKELEITDEQNDKLPAEVMVAISKVLNEKQFKRFKQLELQKRGNNAFKDETILKALNATDEQSKSLTSIVDDSSKELVEATKAAFGGGAGAGGFKGMQEKLKEKRDSINKDTTEKIYGVLTKDQRKAWRDMIGEKFAFEEAPVFGGGGFGGFGKKGADKKDPQ